MTRRSASAARGAARPVSAATLVRDLWAAINRQDAASVEPLVHPDARLEMAMALRNPVVGRQAVMATLRAAWQRVHSLKAVAVHELGPETVIVEGRSRYPLPGGGFADSGFVWLCEWREGMLWQQRLFASVDEAVAAAPEWERPATALLPSSPA